MNGSALARLIENGEVTLNLNHLVEEVGNDVGIGGDRARGPGAARVHGSW
jgi:hypothetical protein